MIAVEEAKQKVRTQVMPLPPMPVPLESAVGLITADDICAPVNIPAFTQAGMDGYALRFADWQPEKSFPITAIVPAGAAADFVLNKGEAVRIFTGAPLPEGADTVVMQEKTRLINQHLLITDYALQAGGNVRPKGSEIAAGALALPAGTMLTPGAIGFLASLGFHEVRVFPQPKVALLVTGRELQAPGLPLQWGQVYESNSFILQAALKQLGIDSVCKQQVDDDLETLKGALAHAVSNYNLVLLTGGVSVGDYDYVIPAAAACGVQQVFHKVAQKPGKPLYFGKTEKAVVFGLPGNPSSVLTCFYQYVVPALEQLTGRRNLLPVRQMVLEQGVRKIPGLTHFLKGVYSTSGVQALGGQESYRLSSFAVANCLLELGADQEYVAAGSLVDVYVLPGTSAAQ